MTDNIEIPCICFDQPGEMNTERTLEIAAENARLRNISSVLIASTSGKTGFRAAELIQVKNLIVVSHSTGFAKPDFQQLDPEMEKKIKQKGARILTCQHALGGVGRAVRKRLGTYELEEIIAHVLRLFGQGLKVAVEISLMAADAGLVSTREPCLSIGGTSAGADTAVILKPAHAQDFFDLKILAVLAKPYTP